MTRIQNLLRSSALRWTAALAFPAILVGALGVLLQRDSSPSAVGGAEERWRPFLFAALLVLVLWCLFLAAVWTVRFLAGRREKKRDAKLYESLQQDGDDAAERDSPEFKRKRAQATLRSAGYGLYSKPFYLIIGASQSGKTTVIKKSDLSFPIGDEPVVEFGGTRGHEWYFPNDAVIIDTAGRYVEHLGASREEWNAMLGESREEWNGFLEQIARARPRAPINGLILTIRVPDLLDADPRKRDRHGKTLWKGLLEIEEKLGLRAPVYVIVTMCDLLPGFVEHFDHLPWLVDRTLLGWTRAGAPRRAFDKAELEAGLEGLCDALDEQGLRFLEEQRGRGEGTHEDQVRIDRLASFPSEFRALQTAVAEFVARVFARSDSHDQHFLRGVYFTSGVQKGSPITSAAREVLGARAESLLSAPGRGKDDEQRAYFIHDFFKALVLRESGLSVPSSRAGRKVTRRRRMLLALAGAVALASTAWVVRGSSRLWGLPERLQEGLEITPGNATPAASNWSFEDLRRLVVSADDYLAALNFWAYHTESKDLEKAISGVIGSWIVAHSEESAPADRDKVLDLVAKQPASWLSLLVPNRNWQLSVIEPEARLVLSGESRDREVLQVHMLLHGSGRLCPGFLDSKRLGEAYTRASGKLLLELGVNDRLVNCCADPDTSLVQSLTLTKWLLLLPECDYFQQANLSKLQAISSAIELVRKEQKVKVKTLGVRVLTVCDAALKTNLTINSKEVETPRVTLTFDGECDLACLQMDPIGQTTGSTDLNVSKTSLLKCLAGKCVKPPGAVAWPSVSGKELTFSVSAPSKHVTFVFESELPDLKELVGGGEGSK